MPSLDGEWRFRLAADPAEAEKYSKYYDVPFEADELIAMGGR